MLALISKEILSLGDNTAWRRILGRAAPEKKPE